MPQPKKAARYGGSPSHHNMILANLATELFRHGRITTTLSKARTMQPLAERMVTFAKRGDLASRRQVLRVIRDRDVVHKLFTDVGPAFAERNGGCTRVVRIGPRKGDAAEMAIIELVAGVSGDGDAVALDEAPRRRWSLRRSRGTQSVTARERSEERAAAIDRGEDLGADYIDEDEHDHDEPAAAADEDGPQVDPAEVEARLAAEEDGEPDAAESEHSDADADDADADDADADDADAADADADDADADDADADDADADDADADDADADAADADAADDADADDADADADDADADDADADADADDADADDADADDADGAEARAEAESDEPDDDSEKEAKE